MPRPEPDPLPQILTEAGTSVLATANSTPQSILSLLKNKGPAAFRSFDSGRGYAGFLELLPCHL